MVAILRGVSLCLLERPFLLRWIRNARSAIWGKSVVQPTSPRSTWRHG